MRQLFLKSGEGYAFRVGFEIRDIWIGVFWDRRNKYDSIDTHKFVATQTDIYVCPIPCLVLHLRLLKP